MWKDVYFTLQQTSPYSLLTDVPLGYKKGVRETVALTTGQRSRESNTKSTWIFGGGITLPRLFPLLEDIERKRKEGGERNRQKHTNTHTKRERERER